MHALHEPVVTSDQLHNTTQHTTTASLADPIPPTAPALQEPAAEGDATDNVDAEADPAMAAPAALPMAQHAF
jgi:hypothetical protein